MESRGPSTKVSRFWEKYIEKSRRYNIPEHLIRWYVRHAELYIKAHSLRLKRHSAKTVDEYCQAKGRNIHLKDYQYCQMIDALRILFLDVVALDWAADYPWDEMKLQAKSLEPTHPPLPELRLMKNRQI